VGDEEVEDGPDEGEAAFLAGEPAHHLGSPFDLAERSLQKIGRPPRAAVSGRVAQVHDQRVEIVGQAIRRGGVAVLVELIC